MSKKLLIIGNGFDLQCNCKTSYLNFFYYLSTHEKYKESYDYFINDNYLNTKITNRINIWWALLLSYHNLDKEWLWKDIEQIMESFLLSPSEEFKVNLSNILKNLTYYLERIQTEYNSINIPSTVSTDIKFLLLLYKGNMLRDLYYFKQNFYDKSQYVVKKIDDVVDILQKDLLELESKFSEYLNSILKEDNNYHILANDLYSKILDVKYESLSNGDDISTRLSRVLNDTNIMSFNYTRLGQPSGFNFTHFKNIHGTIHNNVHNDIIFGIDGSNIIPSNPIYVFTKTFRTSLLDSKFRKVPDIFEGKIDFSNLDEIIIYGHSLNKQDYSYYFAIFNLSSISSNAKIKLFYSNYDNVDRLKEKSLLLQQLIYDYEVKFNVPRGLYHRMLIESRIVVQEL